MPFFKKTAHNRCSVALCAVLVPILTFSLGANLVTLVSESASMDSSLDPQALIQLQQMGQVIKYGVIVVATVPIICVYPFIQKYFVKGVMIGSVKG